MVNKLLYQLVASFHRYLEVKELHFTESYNYVRMHNDILIKQHFLYFHMKTNLCYD